jgi:hypothetical protein
MNKTDNGFCKTTTCINPLYSNIGTAQYGQGVQKRIVTNADRIRAMTDEELAETMLDCFAAFYEVEWSKQDILDWLRQEVET